MADSPTHLFGLQAPKFVVGSTTHNLDYCQVLVTPETDFLEHKSVINGHREYPVKGEHRTYELIIFLFKITSPTDRAYKHLQLKGLLGATGKFYQHRDGSADKNSSSAEVDYVCTLAEDFALSSPRFDECLRMKFQSKDYIDTTKSVIVTP